MEAIQTGACSKALPTASKALRPLWLASDPSYRASYPLQLAKDGRTEFLPILQDFVPYRGRCPATIEVTIKKTIKETVKQGKGTGDHLMPLDDWFTKEIKRK